jgi:hypothetical protein
VAGTSVGFGVGRSLARASRAGNSRRENARARFHRSLLQEFCIIHSQFQMRN